MFVLLHFFACIFCRVRTCNGCWNTSRKSTPKLSRLVLQIAPSTLKSAPSNGSNCPEQLGGLPRAICCRAGKLILPAELPFIPHRSHSRTRRCSLRNGQSAVRSLSVDQLLKAVRIRGSGLFNQLSQTFVRNGALTNEVAEVRLDIAQRTDRNLCSLPQDVFPESLGDDL